MKGKPKFKIGDEVCFEWKGETKVGIVFVVDAYGTFFDDSDASYDIKVEKENMLYKHFNEKLVKPYIQANSSMKIIENKYEDHVFPRQVKCEHCGSILELEREDCIREWNRCTHWYDYRYTCPCCKQESKFENPL